MNQPDAPATRSTTNASPNLSPIASPNPATLSEAESTVLPEREAWKAMVALSLGFFISLMDQTMVAVALPSLQRALDADINRSLWVSSGYLLAVVVPLLFTGRLGDIYGQRTLFRIGISIFALGALGCALAPSIELLIAIRVFQGFGASLLMPQTMSVINRVFARHRRGRALGVWGIVGSLASLIGPLVGGFVVGAFGWNGVFWLPIPVAIIAVILAGRWVPRLPTHARAIDWLSVAVSLIAMSLLVTGIQQGPVVGWNGWVIAAVVAGIGGLGVFVWCQHTAARRGTEALVPLELFTDRNYSLGTVSILAMGFMAASMMLPIMLWLQDAQGLTSVQAGMVMVPMAAVSLVFSPLAGVLVDRMHPRHLSQAGFAVTILAFGLMWWIMRQPDGLSPWWLSGPAATLGLGQAFVWGTNSATTMRDINPARMGAASGVYNTSRQVGSVVGVAVLSAVMQTSVAQVGLAEGTANSLSVIVVVLVLGLVAVTFFRDTLHSGRDRTVPVTGGSAE